MQQLSEVEKMQTQEHWAESDNASRIKNVYQSIQLKSLIHYTQLFLIQIMNI